MSRQVNYIIAGLFFIALLLRVYRLGDYPAGFTADEAAQGYTAYSILKTGRDEWGVKFPLNPRSFGDFKAPVYTYLTVPSIAIFGLNEYSVRLPNAILGSLAVLVVYFLVLALFKQSGQINKTSLALVSALLLAINPWHISLSRGAFEANLTTFFLPLGICLFILGLRSSKFLVLSSIVFGINLFTYHSAKLVTPILVVSSYWLLGSKRVTRLKVISGLLFLIFVIIAGLSLVNGGGARAADIGIFSGGWQEVANQRYTTVILGLPDLVARVFTNKLTFMAREFINNYLSYASLFFLFGQGAGEATYGMIPGRGLLYLIEVPLVLFSFYLFLKQRDRRLLFLWLWVLVGFVPAALSRGVGYHANRAAVVTPAIQILSAYGLITLVTGVRTKYKKGLRLVILIIFGLSLANFIQSYYYFAPAVNGPKMSYGWRMVSQYLNTLPADKVLISRKFSEPQAYLMFYQKMDPKFVQNQTGRWLNYLSVGNFVDQMGEYSLGRYTIKNLSFPEDAQPGIVMVGTESDFFGNQGGEIIKTIVYPWDKQIAIKIVKY